MMQWADVLNDKSLNNLPYKIELNQWGQIVMSPASNRHGSYQGKIAAELAFQLKEGEVITECSIQTAMGVKVADIAWASDEFIGQHGFETPFTESPEICVEILSPSNSQEEMSQKTTLYLNHGSKEVWIVSEEGDVKLYDATGLINHSQFNVTITLDKSNE